MRYKLNKNVSSHIIESQHVAPSWVDFGTTLCKAVFKVERFLCYSSNPTHLEYSFSILFCKKNTKRLQVSPLPLSRSSGTGGRLHLPSVQDRAAVSQLSRGVPSGADGAGVLRVTAHCGGLWPPGGAVHRLSAQPQVPLQYADRDVLHQ